MNPSLVWTQLFCQNWNFTWWTVKHLNTEKNGIIFSSSICTVLHTFFFPSWKKRLETKHDRLFLVEIVWSQRGLGWMKTFLPHHLSSITFDHLRISLSCARCCKIEKRFSEQNGFNFPCVLMMATGVPTEINGIKASGIPRWWNTLLSRTENNVAAGSFTDLSSRHWSMTALRWL